MQQRFTLSHAECGIKSPLQSSSGKSISLDGKAGGADVEVVGAFVVGFLLLCVEGGLIVVDGGVQSSCHCPGFGELDTGLAPSADGVLGGLAHSG